VTVPVEIVETTGDNFPLPYQDTDFAERIKIFG